MTIEIAVAILTSAAVIGFFEFLIKRHDGKVDKRDETLKELKSLKTDIHEFKDDVEKRFDQMDRKVDDSKAIQARARILRFNDEVQTGHTFSEGAWSQTKRDIFDYEAHCNKYPDFPNGEAVSAINNLRIVHEELLERQRNGEKVFL